MIKLVRTNSENRDFINMVKQLDAYLAEIDGEEHAFYNQFNTIAILKNTVVVYMNNKAVGCGAFKEYNKESVEIKRMYTLPETRGQSIATKILKELEDWAKELEYRSCVLETGKRQIEAVQFYKKSNYNIIPSYGQYKNIDNSLCFEKKLL